MVLWSFIKAARNFYRTLQKCCLLNLELTEAQTGKISALVNILKANFDYVFLNLAIVETVFLKKLSNFY